MSLLEIDDLTVRYGPVALCAASTCTSTRARS